VHVHVHVNVHVHVHVHVQNKYIMRHTTNNRLKQPPPSPTNTPYPPPPAAHTVAATAGLPNLSPWPAKLRGAAAGHVHAAPARAGSAVASIVSCACTAAYVQAAQGGAARSATQTPSWREGAADVCVYACVCV